LTLSRAADAYSHTLVRAAAWLSVLAGIAGVAAFAREIVQASAFGGGAEVDAYLVAVGVPFLISTSLVSTLEAAVVPVYLTCQTAARIRAEQFVRALYLWLLAGGIAVTIALMALLPWLLPLQAPGYSAARIDLVTSLATWTTPAILFAGLYGLGRSILNAEHRFTWPALAPAVSAVVMIAVMVIGRGLGARALAIGYTAGMMGAWLTVYVPIVVGRLPGARPSLEWLNGDVRTVARATLALLSGVAAMSAIPVVDRYMASRFPPGVISALAYADRVVQIPMTLVATAVTTATFPLLSRTAARGDVAGIRATLGLSIRLLAALLVPAAVLLVVAPGDVVRAIFERGAFGAQEAELTTVTLRGLAVGLLFMGVLQVLPRAFNAMQLAGIVALSGLLNLGFKIALNIMLVPIAGYRGFALATSFMYIATGVTMAVILRNKLSGIDLRASLPALARVAAAGLVMAAVAAWVSHAMTSSASLVRLLATAGLSGVAYLGSLWLLSGRPRGLPRWLRASGSPS
jgi:putative peptidoglycan lipid II flippase